MKMEGLTSCMTLILYLTVCVEPAYSHSTGLYADNGLYQTVLVDRLPGSHKKAIKKEILSLLGLERRPKPTHSGTKSSAPEYMLDLWRTMEVDTGVIDGDEEVAIRQRLLRRHLTLPGMDRKAGQADIIMSFTNHAGKSPMAEAGERKDRLFFFDMHEVPTVQAAIGAELRLYKNATTGNKTYSIEILMVKYNGSDTSTYQLESVVNQTVHDRFEGWLELDVTPVCSTWTYYPRNNLGLVIHITDQNGKHYNPRKIGLINRKGPDEKKAFLVVFYHVDQEVLVRRTRAAPRREKDVTYADEASFAAAWGMPQPQNFVGRSCQRRSLYVSFRDLGWQEWIIAPEGYSAFYCHGECNFPLNVHMNATNHAIVQTLVHLMNPGQVPKPSCAPTKLTAISVLYFDDNSNVILKKYRNMVVRACGCH